MRLSRSRLLIAVVVATLFGVASYLVATVGVRAMRSTEPTASTGPGHVPEFVYSPPETVPTTGGYGPVGPVSMVFAGTKVVTGFSHEVDNPWIAVSSQTGQYRALSAPHMPEPAPRAIAVSPQGTRLAWGFDGGLVVYDPVNDRSRELHDVGGDPVVGAFSPDGRHLTAYDGALRVVDVARGKVVATLDGVDRTAARQAVWTPDGTALSYVEGGQLVTRAWQADRRTQTPTSITPDASLAWQPSGKQIAAMRDVRGVRSVRVFDLDRHGRLTFSRDVAPDRYSQQVLLGFTSDTRVTVTALSLDSGPLPLVYTMSTVDTTEPMEVMQLSGGIDWGTLAVAARPLAHGSASFAEPRWPARDLAKLVGSVVVALLALGFYLTRRPRESTRRRLWRQRAMG